ncbi:mannitol dehydrogenase family protein [Vibrio sp. SM6]|uniref:Mannitol dehydrogenase family protein n=1 Tax=Vibrio agarilyticus TaxID=2726741 RepID=A0A7X8TTW0_9VIBR|nr:mannitol dehydrogenase family protein [Vibrio agarilyticus]NLS14203.1 mannitol dehydrogenase family protein [Vibrio agarilyticus]
MGSEKQIGKAKYSQVTQYNRDELVTQIVHIGFGAFHRGHQALYTDLTNELANERWGICEINMFGPADLINDLNQQDGLFTVVEKSASETTTRQIRTVTTGLHTPDVGIEAAIQKMLETQVKIVSLTITEKGYCVDPQSRQLDTQHALIIHDLANPTKPQSAIGLITEALKLRKELGLMPFSVMSCDNIPENGDLTKKAVLDFAALRDAELEQWISENVTFPNTMVDRIVPAMTPEQFEVIEQETGYRDPCGVVCEDFRQWVVEDNFVAGRPSWEVAGAMLVQDVLPYEEMKLRMLNGSHSFLAYNGSLAGHEFIYQCMEHKELREVTLKLMKDEQAKSLNPSLDVDLDGYAELLIARFSNANVKHKTGQIAMDGSQKLPQRAVDPYMTLRDRGVATRCLPVLIAGWMHYVIDQIQAGKEVFDPLAQTFEEIVTKETSKLEKAQALLDIEKIFGGHKAENALFIQQTINAFKQIEELGVHTVIAELAQ